MLHGKGLAIVGRQTFGLFSPLRGLRGRARARPVAPIDDEPEAITDKEIFVEPEMVVPVHHNPPPPPPADPAAIAAAVKQRRATELTPFHGDAGHSLIDRKTASLPEWLRDTVVGVITQSQLPRKILKVDCRKLHEFLFSREVVPNVQKEVPAAGSGFAPELHYGARESLAHLASRYPVCYGSAAAVFAEVRLRLPHFAPSQMMDFGSGAGAATLAAAAQWQQSMTSATCVETSNDMTRLAESVFDGVRAAGESGPLTGVDIHHRSLIPGLRTGQDPPYHLVVASFSLCEITDTRLRRTVIQSLWSLTSGCLVLVESGNRQGFALIDEARSVLAEHAEHTAASKASDVSAAPPAEMQMISPCPHMGTCPRAGTDTPCHFPLRAEYPSGMRFLGQEERHGLRSEKLSYLVLARPDAVGAESTTSFGHPRVVGPPRQRAGHIYFELCGHAPDGGVSEVVIPRSVGKSEWVDAKQRSWGDTFPPYSKLHGSAKASRPE